MAGYIVTVRYLRYSGEEVEKIVEVEGGSFGQALERGFARAELWMDPAFMDIRKVEVECKTCRKS